MVQVGCLNCGHSFFDASNGAHIFSTSPAYDSEIEILELPNGGGVVYLSGDTTEDPPCGSIGLEIVKNGSKTLAPWSSAWYCNNNGNGQLGADTSVSALRLYPDGTFSSFNGDFHAVALIEDFWGWSVIYELLLNGTTGNQIWSFDTSTPGYLFSIQPYLLMAGMTLPRGVIGAFEVDVYKGDSETPESSLLYAFNSDGTIKLVRNLTSAYDWLGKKIVTGGLTLPSLIQHDGTTLAAVNPFTLEILWNVSLQVQVPPMTRILVEGRLFGIGTIENTVQVIDLVSGKNVSSPIPINFNLDVGVQGQFITVQQSTWHNSDVTSNWIAAYDPLNTAIPKSNLTLPLAWASNLWSVNVMTGDFYSVNNTVFFAKQST